MVHGHTKNLGCYSELRANYRQRPVKVWLQHFLKNVTTILVTCVLFQTPDRWSLTILIDLKQYYYSARTSKIFR